MSVNGFMKILVRALEVRDHRDPQERHVVYEMSRQTLERFFLQSPAIDEAGRAAQRGELEAAIAEIEHRVQADSAAQERAAAEPAIDAGTPPAPGPSDGAPLAVATPSPEAGEAPGIGPEPARRDDDPADRAAAVAGRPERHHLPPAEDLFEVLPDEAPPSAFEMAIEAEEADAKRRNRRGMQVLLGLLLVIVVASATGLDETIRRLLVGRTLPGSSIDTIAATAPAVAGPTLGDEVALLARSADAGTTAARLVIEGSGGAAVDVVGRIAWTKQGPRDRPEVSGRITFPGRSTVIELRFEDETSGGDGFDRMIVAGFIDLPEALIDVAMFSRVDPKGLAERGAEGTVVRIGLDRALYGYRGVPADRAAAFDERSLIRLRFTLESGRRGQVLLRLPDPG